jgi:two-component system phosphate regulon response regulator PhoB
MKPPAAPRVLVLDDSLLSRTVVADGLSDAGYIVDVAATVPEALNLVTRQRPDVAILDLFLGEGKSGLELARNLRRDPATAETFIVVLSGHYAPDCLHLARAAACDRVLIKPCENKVLIETIEQFLGMRRGRAPASA